MEGLPVAWAGRGRRPGTWRTVKACELWHRTRTHYSSQPFTWSLSEHAIIVILIRHGLWDLHTGTTAVLPVTLWSSVYLMFAASGYAKARTPALYPQEHLTHRGYVIMIPPPRLTSCTSSVVHHTDEDKVPPQGIVPTSQSANRPTPINFTTWSPSNCLVRPGWLTMKSNVLFELNINTFIQYSISLVTRMPQDAFSNV